jgi:hypothetical protein
VALWSCVHSGRDHLVVVVHLLAARVAAMSDITKCVGYIEKDRPAVPRTLCGLQPVLRSDDEFTLSDVERMRRWGDFDYLSYRDQGKHLLPGY